MYTKKELAQKGFIPVSARAALASPHKPPISCTPKDYQNLPPEIQQQYYPQPMTIGRSSLHQIRRDK